MSLPLVNVGSVVALLCAVDLGLHGFSSQVWWGCFLGLALFTVALVWHGAERVRDERSPGPVHLRTKAGE